MRKYISLFLWSLLFPFSMDGQNWNLINSEQTSYEREEKSFYAETKQVNQFIRRFNAEENVLGIRLSSNDSLYHSSQLRKNYINMLFDNQNTSISDMLKSAFINDVTQDANPKFLDFHGGEWFGETFVKFDRGSQEVFITLFMELVKENLGSKWVVGDIYYNPYEDLYGRDAGSGSRFLHPLSHELDFMNLDRVFKSGNHTGDYFYQGFHPDKLSIFMYELRNNTLQFNYVSGVKFHFFQIDGWYFEITEFNRPGLNRGWLISNLIKLEDGQKQKLINFIYHRD
nr:hypothetical protein [Bacteroidota bacterium]